MPIVSAILPPWASIPISGPVRKELERRKSNYGISYKEKENYSGEYTLVKTQGIDVHVMNKKSLLRVFAEVEDV